MLHVSFRGATHLNAQPLPILVLLVVQTTAIVLFMSYSRTRVHDGPSYKPTVAVFFAEAFKLPVCFVVATVIVGGPSAMCATLRYFSVFSSVAGLLGSAGQASHGRGAKRASSRQTAARAVTRTPRFLSVGSPARPPPRTSRSEFPTTSTQRPTDTTNANAAAATTATTPGPLPSAAESPTATYRPTARRAMRAASPLSPLKS